MVMDADTILDAASWSAVRRMTDDRALMAIGGLFYGEQGRGLLGQFQRNEYARYAREIKRRRGRVFVLTGTASLFRPRALRTVAERTRPLAARRPRRRLRHDRAHRGQRADARPEVAGRADDLAARLHVVTEVMPTWKALWVQRLRWQRGALENLGAYGLRPQTFRYWAQQLGIGYGAIALAPTSCCSS